MPPENTPDQPPQIPPAAQPEREVPDAVVEQIEAADTPQPDELRPEKPMQVTQERRGLKKLLTSKKFWMWLVLLIVLGGALAWLILPSRIFIVNTLGLRATLTITSVASAEPGQQRPLLKNTQVTINGKTHHTDQKGKLTLQQPYGEVFIKLNKPGYKEVTQQFLLDFDPFFYQLGGWQKDDALRNQTIALQSVGLVVQFKALDWLTASPITNASFHIGDIVAQPDDQGVVKVAIPATDAKEVSVAGKFGGAYLDKTTDIPIATPNPHEVTYVPAGTHYFASQRNGGYALYQSNLDGGEVAEVLASTPHESAALAVSVSPNGKFGAVTSTREGLKNSRGIVHPRLYILEFATKKLVPIETADAFNVVDWVGDSVVYRSSQIEDNQTVQRLVAVEAPTAKRTQLAQATAVEDIYIVLGNAAYMVSTATNANSPELKAVSVRGGTEKSLGFRVRAATQPDYDRLAYQTDDGLWHEYNFNSNQAKDTGAPASLSRRFLQATSANGQYRLYRDRIDGIPALIARNVASGQDKQLVTAANLSAPIRWVGNTAVFRQQGVQSADYAQSPSGGDAKKIIQVPTATAGQEFN